MGSEAHTRCPASDKSADKDVPKRPNVTYVLAQRYRHPGEVDVLEHLAAESEGHGSDEMRSLASGGLGKHIIIASSLRLES